MSRYRGTRPSRWRSLHSGGRWRKARKVPVGSGTRWRPGLHTGPGSLRRKDRQCGSPGRLGSFMETKSLRGGTAHPGWSRRSKPSHRRGRDRLQQPLVKTKQREEHGTARLLLQCSGGVCREGYFLLPFNE
jgi:hypothetical protein